MLHTVDVLASRAELGKALYYGDSKAGAGEPVRRHRTSDRGANNKGVWFRHCIKWSYYWIDRTSTL
jgi:hypothetical protein